MISGNTEVARQRELAMTVFQHIEHMCRFELSPPTPMALATWDFRRDHPDIVDEGEIARRSLQQVEDADALVAFLGPSIGHITRLEIRRAVELHVTEGSYRVWVFLETRMHNADHDAFLLELRHDYHKDIVYQHWDSELALQALLFTTLVPFVLGSLTAASPPLIRPGM